MSRMEGSVLISVSDKSRLGDLASTFHKHGLKIIASRGTANAIRKLGYKATDAFDHSKYFEMPGGLVKTLDWRLQAGILGDWNDNAQKRFLRKFKVPRLDFVVVSLYPFQDVTKRNPKNLRKAVENVDIGGVTLIRAAAKGALLNKRVVPVASPHHYDVVFDELAKYGKVRPKVRVSLVKQTFALTAQYEKSINQYFSKTLVS